tara:strand:+ start:300 stop:1535 length:1236 start_codon:yes stop_codon:yes gene_type:complete
MAIDFPNSPSVGDTHSDGGAVWRWNGYAWRRIPDPGAKGEPGAKGDKGQKGEVGLTGAQGNKGEKGAPSTVAGDKGQKGDVGFTGDDGATGDKGEKGEPSTVVGPKGDKGDKGGTGAGTKGEKGAGSSVTIGTSPPTSPTPAPGDMWWDSDDADLHVYYNDGNSAQWVSVTSSAALKGQTGDKGQKGEVGVTGDKGQKGNAGAAASKGQKGEIGATGGTGGTGNNGDKGQKGDEGSAGSTGIPTGTIAMFGSASAPSGWQLCNGGTALTSALQAVVGSNVPDLRDKFVVGSGSSYSYGSTGGSSSVTLSTSQLPSHTHGSGSYSASNVSLTGDITKISECYNVAGAATGVFSKKGTGNSPVTGSSSNSPTAGVDFDASHSHSVSGTSGGTGSGSSIENRPPYYAVTYIIKT